MATNSALNQHSEQNPNAQSRMSTNQEKISDHQSVSEDRKLKTAFKETVCVEQQNDVAARSELTENISYKHVSELSDATEDVHAESLGDDDMNELDDYEMLVKAT